jgi:hypothetical protein
MKVCLYVNKSDRTPWAAATVPNTAEYCLRHGYSLIVRDIPYMECIKGQDEIIELLSIYDLVWTIDADCLITNHRIRIEDVPGLGRDVTVCEEGMPWLTSNRINCGSIVYRATEQTKSLLRQLRDAFPEWCNNPAYPFISQSWLGTHAERFVDSLTILPPRVFNSVAWQQNGGGTLWQSGDLVYHPCCHPHERRLEILKAKLGEVIK